MPFAFYTCLFILWFTVYYCITYRRIYEHISEAAAKNLLVQNAVNTVLVLTMVHIFSNYAFKQQPLTYMIGVSNYVIMMSPWTTYTSRWFHRLGAGVSILLTWLICNVKNFYVFNFILGASVPLFGILYFFGKTPFTKRVSIFLEGVFFSISVYVVFFHN